MSEKKETETVAQNSFVTIILPDYLVERIKRIVPKIEKAAAQFFAKADISAMDEAVYLCEADYTSLTTALSEMQNQLVEFIVGRPLPCLDGYNLPFDR